MKYCSLNDCQSKSWCRGYCVIHYGRWYRWGDPNKITREKHGMANSREYTTWESMIARCHNKNNSNYKKYGAVGIEVCDEWRYSFIKFYEDMGGRPDGMTLDRIDNLKGYNKENCRWATRSLQQANRKPKSNTGALGVTRIREGRYVAQITKDRKHKNLGYYQTLGEARLARVEAEIRLWGQKL